MGKNSSTGGIKTKNEWVHAAHWDCVIFDEYHYGAWRENVKELFEAEGKKELEFGDGEGIEYFNVGIYPGKLGNSVIGNGTQHTYAEYVLGEFIT